jgi:hypothetical protein
MQHVPDNLHPFLINCCDSDSDKDFSWLLLLHNERIYRLKGLSDLLSISDQDLEIAWRLF